MALHRAVIRASANPLQSPVPAAYAGNREPGGEAFGRIEPPCGGRLSAGSSVRARSGRDHDCTSRDLGHRRARDGRRHPAAVGLAGGDLGRCRRGGACAFRAPSLAGRACGHGQGHGRLSLSDRHDAACRSRAPGGPVRLARNPCHQSRQWLAGTAVQPGLPRRHRGHGLPVERRDGGRADAGGLCGGENREGKAPALSRHLRLYRQRRELRPADLEPGQPRPLRPSKCRRFGPGFSSLPCRRCCPSPPPTPPCAGSTAATSRARSTAMRSQRR